MIKYLKGENFDEEIQNGIVLVDFYADWCGPCRRVAPIMEKLAEEYDGKLLVYKVNTDQERGLSAAFQVKSIPMPMQQ